jgi:hypothetical protein
VAGETLVRVEARAEAVVCAFGHNFNFSEPRLAIQKENCFIRRKTGQRTAGTLGTAAHTRVDGAGGGGVWLALTEGATACGEGQSNDSEEVLESGSPEWYRHDDLP